MGANSSDERARGGDQAASPCQGDEAECPQHRHAETTGDGTPAQLVDEHEIRSKGDSERQSGGLACVELLGEQIEKR